MANSTGSEAISPQDPPLPDGVRLIPLKSHEDARGDLTEIFRDSWEFSDRPLQWNLVRSGGNVLRGVHTHAEHQDYLVVLDGEMLLGLRDSRAGSATFGRTAMVRLRGSAPRVAVIPTGVSHGFYFPRPSMLVYGMTVEFTRPEDAICRWDDPELALDWPCDDPVLSEKDAAGMSYAETLAFVARRESAA